MDFSARRPGGGTKYGKSRKVLGYNFFETETKQAPVAPATTRFPISPSSPGSVLLDKDEPVQPPQSPSRPPFRPAHITSHSRSSVSYSNDSRPESPIRQSSMTSLKADQSMFDLQSSDDEQHARAQPPTKRRRLARPLNQKQASINPTETVPVAEKTKRIALAKKEDNLAAQPSSVEPKPKMPLTALRKPVLAKPVAYKKSGTKPTNDSETAKVLSKTRLKKATYSKKSITTSRPQLQRAQEEDLVMEEAEAGLMTGPDTGVEHSTASAGGRTPRKQPLLTDSDLSAASPSQLGLNHLRLTPDKITRPRISSASASPETKPYPPRRGRQRRVDLLDAPGEGDGRSSTRTASAESTISPAPPMLKPEVSTEKHPSPARPELPRTSSSQTRQTYGRARNTYRRERSHLKDMVDNLDGLSNDSSQEAGQQLLSQLASQSGPSQLQMELELDSSSDDAGLGVKLKSIHELRQAGTNNRFERDLETLLEDIDPSQATASKSLRLQSLMKLFRRLADDDFTSFVSDRALDRLASWSKLVKDKLSKLLFDMILWRLVHAKNLSPAKLSMIAKAVASSTALITSLHSMSQIAKDKKESLSKALLRDLQEFEHFVLQEQLLPACEGDTIVPAAVTIGALHDSLRKLAEAGAINISVGREACRSIAMLLEMASVTISSSAIQHQFIAKLALSLLKLFAGPLDSDLGMSNDEYLSLGNTLASVLNYTLDQNEELVQSVYHFAISLCNDRPQVCRQIALSGLPVSAMHVIDSRFLSLVSGTKTGSPVDQGMLDSIILSLACLLDITEHEDDVRYQFANSSNNPSRPTTLQTLVAIYAEAAPLLKEATTADQGQLLVAFGYLSLLICNLCLSQDIWATTSKLLGELGISDVVASAKELLIYMQTLDMAQLEADKSGIIEDGNTPIDGITQRFGQILAGVRVE